MNVVRVLLAILLPHVGFSSRSGGPALVLDIKPSWCAPCAKGWEHRARDRVNPQAAFIKDRTQASIRTRS
jgi:hypothetical protein